MKATELIKKLQERVDAYGDAEVMGTLDNIGVDVAKKTLFYFYSEIISPIDIETD
jgi:hypothetical protein